MGLLGILECLAVAGSEAHGFLQRRSAGRKETAGRTPLHPRVEFCLPDVTGRAGKWRLVVMVNPGMLARKQSKRSQWEWSHVSS